MHHAKLFACLFLAGTLVQTSHIAAAPLSVLGLSNMSCAAWKKEVDRDLREPYVQWVRGFLTGHNYANQSHQVTEISSATTVMFIDRYCAEHDTATITEAAMRMSDQYSGRNSPITR